MTRITSCLSLAICLVFGGCSSTMNPYRPSFVEMARQASFESGGGGGKTINANGGVSWDYERDKYAELKFSDQLALNYANEMANILRPKFNRSRIAREVTGTAQVAMAGVSGATAAFNLSNTTLAVLGLGGAGLPELQRIFNAKGRAENYQVAVNMIEDAVIEYLSFNQTPSTTHLTQNGVSVVHRTNAAIHIVEQSLAGMLPSVQQMQQATERMSAAGALITKPGAPVVNNVAANPRVEAAVMHVVREPEALDTEVFIQEIKKLRPPPPPPELPTVKQFRVILIGVDKKIPASARAGIYEDVFEEAGIDLQARELQEAAAAGTVLEKNAVTLNEAYRVYPEKRRKIHDLVIKLQNNPDKSPVPDAPLPVP